ncbi:MAG: VWA domain-containing protein [Spirochaetales bacterium]|uniref:VWA domain-containing protein n=1 Tax=Candidatus Thalassospirochaeta sargassi TaxID=3119039 RepID=A0AAJ1IDI6_9SPIO|nr:VWA domain-containing protein [Spirochaetales bacterium]
MINDFIFLNPAALTMLWIPAAVAVAGVYGLTRSRRIMAKLMAADCDGEKTARTRGTDVFARKVTGLVLISSALILIIIGAARPSWNSTETIVSKKGRDVVFVIDVSRSMLAEDLYPNRLGRARLAVLDALSVMDGDRVGLVAFAGSSVVKCPLTIDYSFFRMAVEDLSPDAVSIGGSMIGDALRKTVEDVLAGGSGGYRDIILITDGEDQDSYPLEAAEMLGELDIRLIAIGLGDENEGRRIPVTDKNGNKVFVTHEGQEVWSRLDADTLRKMTSATPGGRYLNVSTGTFDMAEIYSSLIKTREARFIEEETSIDYEEDFQYFLLPAMILVLYYIFISFAYPQKQKRRRK